jgi:hypothetical protein
VKCRFQCSPVFAENAFYEPLPVADIRRPSPTFFVPVAELTHGYGLKQRSLFVDIEVN